MRRFLFLAPLALVVAACTDTTGPTNPLEDAPTVQASHLSAPGTVTQNDLCEGLSPCDAVAYDRDGDGVPDRGTDDKFIGVPGFCFLPPTVDNHLSDPACSAPFVPGLDGFFKLAWCEVDYDPANTGTLDGTQAPTIVSCQQESQWQDLVRDPNGGEFYSASVQFKKRENGEETEGKTFRLYVVSGDLHWAHRDVIVDPNLTLPADDFLKAIGNGTEPIKVRITESTESCVKYDTQEQNTLNAATCLIAGETTISFDTGQDGEGGTAAAFEFPDGNDPFLADFEVSECLSLADPTNGNALVDVPLGDCKISVNSEQVADDELTVPATITWTVRDSRWLTGEFKDSRLNIIQTDEKGTAVLPRSDAPAWFGGVSGADSQQSAFLNAAFKGFHFLRRGLGEVAGLFGPEPLRAYPGAISDWTRMSDFQLALMPVLNFDDANTEMAGVECDGLRSCRDLGTFSGADPVVPVSVHVTAPTALNDPQYPDRTNPEGAPFDVPGARVHFFPENGQVLCPADPQPDGQICFEDTELDTTTDPPSDWPNLVVITGSTGRAVVDWPLGDGANVLKASGCGLATPGTEANPPGEPGADGVWGAIVAGRCEDRVAALTDEAAFNNGPADDPTPSEPTPFEPVDTENEVAIYGLPLTLKAETCPTITPDGKKGDAFGTPEWVCADVQSFSAPIQGTKKGETNAWLYTYDDGESLYIGLEVINDELGNRIFVQLAEEYLTDASGNPVEGVESPGDDILILNFDTGQPGTPADWHLTQSCIDNNANSLCGDPDQNSDGSFALEAAAQLGGVDSGAGPGRVFYEFKRPLGSPNNTTTAPYGKEDLAAPADGELGLKLTVTQGQGGGKGGFTFPDVKTDGVEFYFFTLQK